MGGFSAALSLGRSMFDAWTGPTGSGVTAWILAAVFVMSGVAKLRRPALAAMAMVDFAVVRDVRPALGWMLGAVEVALAIALPIVPSRVATVATVLLWLFVLLIGRSLVGGASFACFCFGDGDSPLSHWTLVRSGALAVAATVLAVGPDPGTLSQRTDVHLEPIIATAALGVLVLTGRIPELLRRSAKLFDDRMEVSA